MRIVNIHGRDDIRVDQIPEPIPGENDVILRIDACGICGSDIGYAKQGVRRSDSAPWPLGHEATGTVVSAGHNVADIAIGDRVVVNPMGMGANVVGNGGTEGAFADFLLVRKARLGRNLLRVPDGVSANRAALTEPLAVALHAINVASPQPGERVVVFGAGPIGLGAIIWLRRRGIEDIVAIDLSNERLQLALKLKASDVINPTTEDLPTRLGEIHGTVPSPLGGLAAGTDLFIDMAGGPTILPDVIKLAKRKARLTLVAVHHRPVEIDLHMLLMKELSITTSVGYPREMPEVLAALASFPESLVQTFVSHTFPFEQFEQAFATARLPGSAKVMVEFGRDK